MIDTYLETFFLYVDLIYSLAIYLFTDFRWAWFLLFALAFDILITLPVTLLIRSRLKETP